MAGPGRAPKETLSRPNDQARREAESTKVVADGVLRGPDLPGDDWPARTLQWWDTLRRSPLATKWLDVDWDSLLVAALLHRKVWTDGDLNAVKELRLRMQSFGTTPESRLRLKVIVENETEAAPAPPVPAKPDRRGRLLKVVGDGA